MVNITIEAVEESFNQWRAHRSSLAEPIPDSLWSMALSLYPEHKRSEICDALRLSGSQFKRRLEKSIPGLAQEGFVLASPVQAAIPSAPCQAIEISSAGKERTLRLSVDVHALHQLLPQMGALL